MANVFISCPNADGTLAKKIEQRLKLRGHSLKVPWGSKLPGDWRGRLQKALEAADAVVVILTDRGLQSPYVLGEVGMARVCARSKGHLILPVLVGQQGIPHFVNDLQCFTVSKADAKELDLLAKDLHEAIEQHVQAKTRPPRIFVSHRHKDESIVRSLVGLLETAFDIDKPDIRCTSVKPYTLPPGERISDRLQADLNGAELVIGVIGPETADSRYVLFELGSAWGGGVPTFPLLVRGATAQDVPGPLKERHSVSLENVANCIQLVADIADETSLERRKGVEGRVADEAQDLVSVAMKQELQPSASSQTQSSLTNNSPYHGSSDELRRAGMHITNYLRALNKRMMSFERVREKINGTYTDSFLLELIDQTPERFRRASVKGGKPGMALV